jgi:diaminopimelate decarboxylase
MEIGRKSGHRMEVLDLGGGFPSGKLNESQIEILKGTKSDKHRVIAEPGRHFS